MTLIQQLLLRDGPNGQHCGEELLLVLPHEKRPRKRVLPGRPTVDHIRPRSKEGISRIDNYQLLCSMCNRHKGDMWDGVSGIGLIDGQMPKMVQRYKPELIGP